MNILFNLEYTQPAGESKRHGGGIYGEIVFKRIVERKLPISAYYNSAKWLNPDILEIINKNNVSLYDINGSSLEELVKTNNIEVVYTPLLRGYFAKFDLCRVIGTVHGLRELETPNDIVSTKYYPFFENWRKYYMRHFLHALSRKRRYRLLAEISKNEMIDFVVVSNHTETSYKVYYPQFSNRSIHVFYSPSSVKDYHFRNYEGAKFFLLVSGNRWEKNVLRAIIAIDEMITDGILSKEFEVKITGANSSNIYRYKIRNKEQFKFLGYISDKELSCLYHDAYCLIYPSLNEGFGYPPLEAMYYGTPVIASAVSSIPEICEDGVMYFSPFDPNEIKCRILSIVNPQIHELYAAKGHKRYLKVREKQDTDLDKLIDYIYSDTRKCDGKQLS